MSWTRHGPEWSHSLFYLTLLLWTRRMNGLADFSSKITMRRMEDFESRGDVILVCTDVQCVTCLLLK